MSKIIIVAAVLTALSLVTGAIAAEGDVVPKRKPGAWEIITVAPVSGMPRPRSALARTMTPTVKTNFDPPIGGIPHMGVKLDGRYLGPDCPAQDDKTPARNACAHLITLKRHPRP